MNPGTIWLFRAGFRFHGKIPTVFKNQIEISQIAFFSSKTVTNHTGEKNQVFDEISNLQKKWIHSSTSHLRQKTKMEETGNVRDQGKSVKSHERVNSTGDEGKKLTKNVESEQLNPDDGSMEFKEKMSPGSTDAVSTAAQASKHPKSDVPPEVADRLADETVDFIKKQSGMSGGASS